MEQETVALQDMKEADTEYPIHDLIRQRWSPRAFDDRPLEEETLLSLFEAARWAASSSNIQPWRFIYAHKGSEAFDTILATLAEGNQSWAQHAPVLMIVAAYRLRSNDKPNRHAWYDTGAAMATLTLQALDLGIYVHQMGGFNPEAAATALNIPDDYAPVAAVALGYLGTPDQLSENNRDRETSARERKSLDEIVFRDTFAAG